MSATRSTTDRDRLTSRRVFHTFADAYGFRDRLERPERDGEPVAFLVRIDYWPVENWRELA